MKTDFIHWFGHDSFSIENAGIILYIDPWKLPAGAPQADYIFVTHSHYDHFSHPDIEKISKTDTRIIGPKDVTDKLNGDVLSLKPNEVVRLDLLEVATIPAYNINKSFHPKNNNWLGYVIKLPNNVKIYHAGDTDFIPEMKSLQVDIALLPVSGTYVMTAEEAAEAANTFKPEIAIPMHFGDIVGSASDAQIFQVKFKGTTVIKSIEK